ncbi:Zinc/iron permease [Blyttiomyces helicus]|uniref:Zinc/iron permease n=1 Tax=Blyttiomyces helicus TaxID=388810 RepID=A0A4P9W6N8_9FUNG|nr:Zinc/iron permease [Blyttiomyces helicus]|eukprot:RKO87994.1 Zinc/iron permease [Blyttiomyces helicus]
MSLSHHHDHPPSHIEALIKHYLTPSPHANAFIASTALILIPLFVTQTLGPSPPKLVISLLSALAVGLVLGDVFLHLLPHGEEMGVLVLLGMLFAFVVESVGLVWVGGGKVHGDEHVDQPGAKDVDSAVKRGLDASCGKLRRRRGEQPKERVQEEKKGGDDGGDDHQPAHKVHDGHHEHHARHVIHAILHSAAGGVHSFVSGFAIGIAFAGSPEVGVAAAVRVAMHEVCPAF